MLISVIIANTPRDVIIITQKMLLKEVLERPMTNTEIRGIMFDGWWQ